MNLMEIKVLDFIQENLRVGFLDWFMPKITVLGDGGIFWILLTLALLIIPRTRRLGLVCGVSLLIDLALCNGLLKNLIARTRPFDVNPDIVLLVPKPGDYSFPSGHAAASFTVVGALGFSKSKLWIPACVLSVIIALSRLYLYVHYPTDVIFGAVFGVVFGFLGTLLVKKAEELIKKRRAEKGGEKQ